MITAWRIVRAIHADEAFTGKGARATFGRWHASVPIVYTASSVSLATLELLVRLRRSEKLDELVIIACYFPEAVVESLDRRLLPLNWRDAPPPSALPEIGNAWLLKGSSVVFEVPSAVTPEESNYLLNPEHPDFASVDIGDARPFTPDPRLLT